MLEAVRVAREGLEQGKGGPFGAIVVKDGVIIGKGANMVLSTNDPTAHAEVQAIREACRHLQDYQLGGCDIYTTCEPCPMCMGAIYWARPDRVYYAGTKADAASAGFDDSFIYEELTVSPEDRKIPMIQIMREDALPLFQLWSVSPFKKPY